MSETKPPADHECRPVVALSNLTDFACAVCRRRYRRHYDETTKQAGEWREVEPAHRPDPETGGYWSGPSLDMVRQHYHYGQSVLATTAVGAHQERLHWTLTRDDDHPDRYSVYRFWVGPGTLWCCTMLVELKPLDVAIRGFQHNSKLAIEELAK